MFIRLLTYMYVGICVCPCRLHVYNHKSSLKLVKCEKFSSKVVILDAKEKYSSRLLVSSITYLRQKKINLLTRLIFKGLFLFWFFCWECILPQICLISVIQVSIRILCNFICTFFYKDFNI